MTQRQGKIMSKHHLITGGASGIGLAIAERLVSEGATVSLLARNTARLEVATQLLNGTSEHRVAAGFACDIRDQDQIKSATNELIANELRASQKNHTDMTGIDYEDVKDAISGEHNTSRDNMDPKDPPLPFQVQALMSKPTEVAFDDEEIVKNMYELPPEMDNMKRRMLWRVRV